MQLTGVDADGKAPAAVFAGVTVGLFGMLHGGNIENHMIPIALLKMIAIRTPGL